MTFQYIITSSIQLQNIQSEVYEFDSSGGPFTIYLPLPEKDVSFVKKIPNKNPITIWGKFRNNYDHIVVKSDRIDILHDQERNEYYVKDCV